MGFMRDHHSRRENAETGINFPMYNAEVPFDPFLRASDSVGQAVIHVWAGTFFLSLGLPLAGAGDRAFHQAPAGRLLALRHLVSPTASVSVVHPLGSAACPAPSSQRI